MEFKKGDKVKCGMGRWEGMTGIVVEYDPDKYGKFCLMVDSVAERVNPDNWIVLE